MAVPVLCLRHFGVLHRRPDYGGRAVITHDKVVATAEACFLADFPPTKHPIVDADRRHAYLLGFARGGKVAADEIMAGAKAITNTNAELNRISEESK